MASIHEKMRKVQQDMERAVERTRPKSRASRVWPHLPSETQREAPTKKSARSKNRKESRR